MDYGLPALKLLVAELRGAIPDGGAMLLCGSSEMRFQRAWLQGILVQGSGNLLLDDGSDAIQLQLPKDQDPGRWKPGMYVLAVGNYDFSTALIKVHKIVDLSASPDREALWSLEVIEAHELFYFRQEPLP